MGFVEFIGLIGFILVFVGGIWMLIAAFQTSSLWGFGCLFIPLVQIVWIFAHFDKAWKPLLVVFAGMFFILLTVIATA